MAVLRVSCVNARGLRYPWKQGRLLNDLRSFDMDVVAVSETRISDTRLFAPTFDGYEIFAPLSQPGMGGGVAVCFGKDWDSR